MCPSEGMQHWHGAELKGADVTNACHCRHHDGRRAYLVLGLNAATPGANASKATRTWRSSTMVV
eukprot:CAMPEP_0119477542 /NCGR_PEP_ID=MMETSP1344-20130328/7645_1 /TAXON_ID=236787 /ORGANISM="Florenciella parvula, Strain CCMP2471" /LENGTH=63 /DNA_ID=CAMNT_0007511555 /DNA_START=59 /DNA_END=247 /DNA_ORIENTATION=-